MSPPRAPDGAPSHIFGLIRTYVQIHQKRDEERGRTQSYRMRERRKESERESESASKRERERERGTDPLKRTDATMRVVGDLLGLSRLSRVQRLYIHIEDSLAHIKVFSVQRTTIRTQKNILSMRTHSSVSLHQRGRWRDWYIVRALPTLLRCIAECCIDYTHDVPISHVPPPLPPPSHITFFTFSLFAR